MNFKKFEIGSARMLTACVPCSATQISNSMRKCYFMERYMHTVFSAIQPHAIPYELKRLLDKMIENDRVDGRLIRQKEKNIHH